MIIVVGGKQVATDPDSWRLKGSSPSILRSIRRLTTTLSLWFDKKKKKMQVKFWVFFYRHDGS